MLLVGQQEGHPYGEPFSYLIHDSSYLYLNRYLYFNYRYLYLITDICSWIIICNWNTDVCIINTDISNSTTDICNCAYNYSYLYSVIKLKICLFQLQISVAKKQISVFKYRYLQLLNYRYLYLITDICNINTDNCILIQISVFKLHISINNTLDAICYRYLQLNYRYL